MAIRDIKKIEQKYSSVSKLIAAHRTEYIGICKDGKDYYIHRYNEIYDFVNPMKPYKEAHYINGALCIIM